MIRSILTISTFLSALFFPWPLTVLLGAAAGMYEPLVPLAVGLFIDVLFYTPGAGWPLATLFGLVATLGMYALRARFQMR